MGYESFDCIHLCHRYKSAAIHEGHSCTRKLNSVGAEIDQASQK